MSGTAAYKAKVKIGGTPVLMTDEPLELVSPFTIGGGGGGAGGAGNGEIMALANLAKSIISSDYPVIIKEDGIDITSSVDKINYLSGTIEYKLADNANDYTITARYIPTECILLAKSFTLNASSEIVNDTGFCEAQANGGYHTKVPTIMDASLELMIYRSVSDYFFDVKNNREDVLIEIQSGDDLNDRMYRGWFVIESSSYTGDVAGIEESSLQFSLSEKGGDNLVYMDITHWI